LEFLRQTLANGLEIVAECNSQAHSTAVGFFVGTGARDETDEVAGVSHFLEHMMFKGTSSRSAEDVNREFDEMGAHYNAFTSEESTVYYAAVLPEHQDRAVGLLGDILRPALRNEDFDTEKQVILEEIQMYLDQPPYGADDRVRALHFAGHPLGRSVLGTQDSIRQLPVQAMRAYFERRYAPGNVSLVGAGRIDFPQLVAEAERICGHWPAVTAGRETPPARPRGAFESLQRETSTQQYVLQLANAPGATDDDRYAAKVLATVLGDDTGSRLFWALIDPGLAEQASLGHYDYQGAGMFLTWLSGEPDNAAANLQRIADLYRQVERDGVTQAELDQAKNKINSRVVLGSERPRGRLFAVGGHWMQRRCYRSVSDDLAAVDRVTCDDLAAVLRKYPLSASTTVTIGPLENVPPPR
jgi:predicted Zn-dependent peptidase